MQASDGELSATQSIAVTVTNVNEAPVIDLKRWRRHRDNFSCREQLGGDHRDRRRIPTSSKLTYSIAGGADAALFGIDASTGALAFLKAPDFEHPTDAGADNTYQVTVQASDGELSATQSLAVTVTNVNEAPVIASNGGGATASISVQENSLAVTTVQATDPDFSELSYSIAGGADAALFGIDANTGALSFLTAAYSNTRNDLTTAATNGSLTAPAGTNNTYQVVVQASDGELSATQSLAVTVTNVNEAPVIDFKRRRRRRISFGCREQLGRDHRQGHGSLTRASSPIRSLAAPTRRCLASTPTPGRWPSSRRPTSNIPLTPAPTTPTKSPSRPLMASSAPPSPLP